MSKFHHAYYSVVVVKTLINMIKNLDIITKKDVKKTSFNELKVVGNFMVIIVVEEYLQ